MIQICLCVYFLSSLEWGFWRPLLGINKKNIRFILKQIILKYVFAIYFFPKVSLLKDLICLVFFVYVTILVCFYTGVECTKRETTKFLFYFRIDRNIIKTSNKLRWHIAFNITSKCFVIYDLLSNLQSKLMINHKPRSDKYS